MKKEKSLKRSLVTFKLYNDFLRYIYIMFCYHHNQTLNNSISIGDTFDMRRIHFCITYEPHNVWWFWFGTILKRHRGHGTWEMLTNLVSNLATTHLKCQKSPTSYMYPPWVWWNKQQWGSKWQHGSQIVLLWRQRDQSTKKSASFSPQRLFNIWSINCFYMEMSNNCTRDRTWKDCSSFLYH